MKYLMEDPQKQKIESVMLGHSWFVEQGAYVLFDGQYGSTGKGLLASVVAEVMGDHIDSVATNAGPNSGHTAYFGGKFMTQQIPVASVVLARMGVRVLTYLNGGAQIDPDILTRELGLMDAARPETSNGTPQVVVHPHAALIKGEHKGDMNTDIASTGKGTGPAQIDKIKRNKDACVGWAGVMDDVRGKVNDEYPNINLQIGSAQGWSLGRCFVETAQGWSLGINSGFYPYVTSRECSVSQALADLGVSPADHKKSIACLRTYPIRVGNTATGYSGPVYPDQVELSFAEIGQKEELTSVTKRVRRLFTWSDAQFADMLLANRPDALFLNFVNYLLPHEVDPFIAERVLKPYRSIMGRNPDFLLCGTGPLNTDVYVYSGPDNA